MQMPSAAQQIKDAATHKTVRLNRLREKAKSIHLSRTIYPHLQDAANHPDGRDNNRRSQSPEADNVRGDSASSKVLIPLRTLCHSS